MADQNESVQELLLDIKVAEASRLYKFYLNHEKAILGGLAVAVFLIIWELVGNVFQWINPMFMSSPSLIFKAAVQLFVSGEIYHDLYVSGIEFLGGYFLAVAVAIPFGIMVGWYKRMSYIFDPFINAMNATPRVALLPLVIIWLGIGILSKVGIIFLGAVFSILINTRRCQNNASESVECCQKFWRVGMDGLQNRRSAIDHSVHSYRLTSCRRSRLGGRLGR